MTTIFSNNEDVDCEILRGLFENIPNNKVIEITYSMKRTCWMDVVEQAIRNEYDTLILCGHGSSNGLYFPKYEDFVIHNLHTEIIHAKRVVCNWCHASSFVKNYNVHNCLATSMFISNVNEANDYGYCNANQNDINAICQQIDSEIKELICSDTPISDWVMEIRANMNTDNEIDVFNRQGIIYNP